MLGQTKASFISSQDVLQITLNANEHGTTFCPANLDHITKVEFKPFKVNLALSCAQACVLCTCVCVCKRCFPGNTRSG